MQLRSFSQYVTEERKEMYFVFGRFNPPTIGHEKLFDVLKKKAGSANIRIYASQSQDPKKNPLKFKEKVKFLRKMFPKYARSIMGDNDVRTVLDIAVKLYEQGYTRIVMVAGSDRIKEFNALLKKYNDVKSRHGYYNFEDGINVISAGDRDPDLDDVSGMSASKMRAAAASGDIQAFSNGVPEMPGGSQLDLYYAVRKGMGLKKESVKHIDLPKVSNQREAYVKGALYNIGDKVKLKESSNEGTITKLGTNFLVVEFGDWKKRVWIDEVELVEACGAGEIGTKKLLSTYRKNTPGQSEAQDPDIKDKKGTQPKAYYAKDAKGKEMSKSTKSKRDAHFKKGAKMDDDNPAAYKPAPGDATAKTKPSKHTKKYQQMFGENTLTFEDFQVEDSTAALKKKAEKTGMPLGILKKVFDRGVAAWRTGHRPGTTAIQWGLARVNSFVTKSKGTWGGADKDLAAKVRGS